MNKSMILMGFAALMAGASPALAVEAKAPVAAAASIPFANNGGIWSWTADDDQTVYFQDRHRQWYRAKLFAPAFDLPSTLGIRVDTGPMGTLDKWSAIYVGHQRYPFQSFDKVDGPPVKAAKAPKAGAES